MAVEDGKYKSIDKVGGFGVINSLFASTNYNSANPGETKEEDCITFVSTSGTVNIAHNYKGGAAEKIFQIEQDLALAIDQYTTLQEAYLRNQNDWQSEPILKRKLEGAGEKVNKLQQIMQSVRQELTKSQNKKGKKKKNMF